MDSPAASETQINNAPSLSAPACSSITFLVPVSNLNLNPTWILSPFFRLKLQCYMCNGGCTAYNTASWLFSTRTDWQPFTIRAAATATSLCAGSRQSPFSSTLVPSTLAMARPEEMGHLKRGARNTCHSAVQVPWWGLRYHENSDIRGLWYQKLLISEAFFFDIRSVIVWWVFMISEVTDIMAKFIRYVYDIVGKIIPE